MRLDKYLSERFPKYSRSVLAGLVRAGQVKVDGVVVRSPAKEVREGDLVELTEPAARDFSGESLPVIYEDENVVVIDKPAGVLTHAKGAICDEFTVAEFVGRYWPSDVRSNRSGVVHRLDRGTSGVMIAAKNGGAQKMLMRQFAQRKTKKVYLAVVEGTLKERAARIELPIGRNVKRPAEFRVDANGKRAVTEYEVLATNAAGESLVELRPETGRTHQLRVHMSYLGAPIKGDAVYGRGGTERMYLHAKSLEISIPDGEGKKVRRVFEAAEPAEFREGFDV